MRRLSLSFAVLLVFSTIALAQNTNSSTTTNARPRTTTSTTQATKPKATATPIKPPAAKSSPSATPGKPASATPGKRSATPAPAADTASAAFDRMIEGIRKASVDLVMKGYLNDPSLVFFNYNGTATRGWEQMRKNRESSYPDMKDVKLDIREKHVQMLGRDGAVVTCLWTQTQTYKGVPDTASGRMTLVFKRVGTAWKAVHLHTSPDRPDPSRVPASEQAPSPSTKP